MGNRRRRYELRHPELNQLVEELVERAAGEYGATEGLEFVREIVVSALRLLREERSTGELKLVNSALKELRHALAVFAPYEHVRKVSVFGSARTHEDSPEWRQAFVLAQRLTEAGWMVITGAGDGIMGAAQAGAGRDASFGVNIQLPFEQRANETIRDDPKLVNFRYFFTRKVMFVKESHAVALLPGGFGTHDEGFEALTLIQTGKSQIMPVVFLDAPGGSYWKDWQTWVVSRLRGDGLIGDDDTSLFTVTDDVHEAVREILGFYANYHSSRFVGDRLILRLLEAPGDEEIEALNSEFADLVVGGAIEASGPLPQEGGELEALPRLLLRADRRRVARLRQLIDRLNASGAGRPAVAAPATPQEVIAGAVSPEQEAAEAEEREL
jgi:uncharacterized protein (TIGR00730 family)